jgi:hypothetical protein
MMHIAILSAQHAAWIVDVPKEEPEMNREILFTVGICLVVLSPTRGYTQGESSSGSNFWGGVTLGGGFFKFVGDGIDSSQSSGAGKPGIVAGGHLKYDFHQRMALHAELLFLTKGSYYLISGERRAFYSSGYLDLPLLARVSLPAVKDTIVPFLAAGPWVGVLLSASGEDLQQGEPIDLDGVYNTIDFGVIFGAGAAVHISPHNRLGLEFRYDMGLRAVVNNRDTINNRGMLLVLRYETCICSRSAAR